MRAILFPILALFLFSACSKNDLPRIDDPKLLAADGASLLAVTGIHTIDRSQWPESIRKLAPLNVVKTGDTIIITTTAAVGPWTVAHRQQIPPIIIGTMTSKNPVTRRAMTGEAAPTKMAPTTSRISVVKVMAAVSVEEPP